MSSPEDLPDDRESTPLLLARLSRPSMPPAVETPRPAPAAPKTAAPPLAGVDWTNYAKTTERLGKAGLLLSMMLLFVAVFADLFASNLPIMCRVDGAFYTFPNVTQPAALTPLSRAELDARASFMLRPLVFHGPRLRPGEVATSLARPGALEGHPLGTDRDGNDVFARIVHGARGYLVFALAAVAASLLLGVLFGAIAGLFGGAFDALVSRIVESVSAFPPLVLVLGIQAAVPRATLFTLFLAIALTRWPEIARLVRGEVLLATTRDYVVAARALGATPLRVLRRHILPNVRASLVVVAAMGVSGVVLTEASLDFLRVGTPPGAASWGETMSQFRDAPGAWWLLAFPGFLLVVTIIAYNVMGEALRDLLDPRR
ncbi:MAG: ABC transporter permease [Labilithrix sp.]|nr:ABC transporter permease [Labilithrix sp.]MCW5815449.1 ABC transporter permease [Labilithrix sp.]